MKPADAGITQELERKGALGKPLFGDRVGFSAEVRGVDYFAKGAQKTDYEIRQDFYAVEKKRKSSQSFASQVKEDVATARILGQDARSKVLQGGPESTRAEMRYAEFITTRGISYAGIGIQKAGEFVRRGDTKVTTYGGRVIEGAGTYVRTQPMQAVAVGYGSAVVGAGVGAAYGYGVKSIAATGAFRTAAVAQAVPNVAGVAAVGYEVATKTPEQIGASIPAYAGIGYGYSRGYSSVVAPKSVSFTPGGKARSVTDSYTETGRLTSIYATQPVKYSATEFGVTVKGRTTAKLVASTTNQPSYGAYRYDVSTSVKYRGVRGQVETAKYSYKARYDPEFEPGRGVFAGIGKGGQAFEIQTSRPLVGYKEGTTTTEAIGVRTTALDRGKISSVSEGVNIRESAKTSRFGTFDRTLTGSKYRVNVLSSKARNVEYSEPGTEVVLPGEMRGYQLLAREGLYKEPLGARARRKVTSIAESADYALFKGPRRAYSGLYFEQPQTIVRQPSTIFEPGKTPVSKIPEIGAIPLRGISYGRSSVFTFGKPQSYTIRTESAKSVKPAFDTKAQFTPVREPTSTIKPASAFDYGTSQIPRYDTSFTPVSDTSGSFTPVPTFTPITPPPTPFIPGIGGPIPNLYRPGGGSGIVKGKARGFQYAPSLTAVAFNIRGSSRGRLSGIEVRPLAPRKVRRKKKR